MEIDNEKFDTLLKSAYRRACIDSFTLDEVRKVFAYYFDTYELITDQKHPMIRLPQITNIVENMPVVYSTVSDDLFFDIAAEDYPLLIDQHFATQYKNCDYNINHFFSGNIRAFRYKEVFG